MERGGSVSFKLTKRPAALLDISQFPELIMAIARDIQA